MIVCLLKISGLQQLLYRYSSGDATHGPYTRATGEARQVG